MRTARNMLCLETPKCRRMTFHRLPHPLPKELGLFASSAETEPPADVGLFAQVLKESCRVLCDVDNVQGACEKGNGQRRERKTWRLRAGSEATTSRGVVDTAAGNARCSCFYLRRCLAQMDRVSILNLDTNARERWYPSSSSSRVSANQKPKPVP